MPAYSAERQKYHLERVRAVMVVRPQASAEEIQRVLEESGEAPLRLDRQYIEKLQRKVVRERTARLERSHLSLRLATIQDKKERIDAHLWQEATNQTNDERARITALGLLFKNELELLQAEMDAGVFERHLGTLRNLPPPLAPELRAKIIEAMINWGIVKPKHADGTPNSYQPNTAEHRLLASG